MCASERVCDNGGCSGGFSIRLCVFGTKKAAKAEFRVRNEHDLLVTLSMAIATARKGQRAFEKIIDNYDAKLKVFTVFSFFVDDSVRLRVKLLQF